MPDSSPANRFGKKEAGCLLSVGIALIVVDIVLYANSPDLKFLGYVVTFVVALLGLAFIALAVLPLAWEGHHRSVARSGVIRVAEILPREGGGYLLTIAKAEETRTVIGVPGSMILIARPDSLRFLRADADLWERVINPSDIPSFAGDDLNELDQLAATANALFDKLQSSSRIALAIIACPYPHLLMPGLGMMGLDQRTFGK